MTAQPWFSGGLRFTCTQCGNCCTGEPGFVWVDDAELAAIAEHLGESPEVVRAVHGMKGHRGLSLREKANGDCTFYDREKGCTVYPVRPRQCRSWPFWESNLASEHAWQATCRVCPGAGQGELVPVAEILRRASLIRI
jgi:Fe-S-cluster containining protein